ncbi:MAG TPA: acyl-CoA dehydrogenase, partial [Pantoea sp.]
MMALSEYLHELLPVISQTLASSAAEVDRRGEFPTANFALLRQHGLLSFALPASAGGGGADLAACRAAIAAVAQG